MVFVWSYYSYLFQDFAHYNLGFTFGNLKLKFDMFVEWNVLIYIFVELWYLCEVIALICFKILLNVNYVLGLVIWC